MDAIGIRMAAKAAQGGPRRAHSRPDLRVRRRPDPAGRGSRAVADAPGDQGGRRRRPRPGRRRGDRRGHAGRRHRPGAAGGAARSEPADRAGGQGDRRQTLAAAAEAGVAGLLRRTDATPDCLVRRWSGSPPARARSRRTCSDGCSARSGGCNDRCWPRVGWPFPASRPRVAGTSAGRRRARHRRDRRPTVLQPAHREERAARPDHPAAAAQPVPRGGLRGPGGPDLRSRVVRSTQGCGVPEKGRKGCPAGRCRPGRAETRAGGGCWSKGDVRSGDKVGGLMHVHDHDLEESALRPKSSRIETSDATAVRAGASRRTDVLDPESVLKLQRAVGNSGVGAMLEEERSPVHDVINSSGSPLEPDCRTRCQARLGHDFSDVRVHTDSAAHDSAQPSMPMRTPSVRTWCSSGTSTTRPAPRERRCSRTS